MSNRKSLEIRIEIFVMKRDQLLSLYSINVIVCDLCIRNVFVYKYL